MRTGKLIIAVLLASLLFPLGGGCARQQDAAKMPILVQQGEINYKTQPVQRRTVVETMWGTGRLAYGGEYPIRFAVGGVLETVSVGKGDRVRKGDPLLALETKELNKRLGQQHIALRKAELAVRSAQQGATQEQVSQAQAAWQQAQQAVRSLEGERDELLRDPAYVGEAELAVAQDRAAVQAAEEALEALQAPSAPARPSQLAQARADLSAAQSALSRDEQELSLRRQGRGSGIAELDEKIAAARREEKARREEYEALTQARPNAAALETARLDLENAELALAQMEAQLEDSSLIAPVDGVVTGIAEVCREDERVEAGVALLHITPDKGLAVSVPVASERELAQQLVLNRQVTVEIRDRSFTGTVVQTPREAFEPLADVADQEVFIEVPELENTDYVEDMDVRVLVELNRSERAIAVPVAAVSSYGGRSFVTVLHNGSPHERSVELGVTDGEWVEIVSGLTEGESIIVN